MEFKGQDPLKTFLRAHEHPTPERPTNEWLQIEERMLRISSVSHTPVKSWWSNTSMGVSICVASFAAVFVWMSSVKTAMPVRGSAPVVALVGDTAIDPEDLVWEALIGEDEGLEDFEQAYVDVLER